MNETLTALVVHSCDNRETSEAARCVNTERPLTHHSLTTRRGLAVKATRIPCDPWNGDETSYQDMAIRIVVDVEQRSSILPWTWATAQCGTPHCLTYGHFSLAAPLRIAYPSLVCVYCGLPGGTRDHLLPRGFTGEFQRQFVATVPACGQCNSLINDLPDWRVTERRKLAHDRLRHRYRKVLNPAVDYRDFEGRLRQYIKADHEKKQVVLARLAWPDDPFYDLRAFQKSGIEDPYAIGLI